MTDIELTLLILNVNKAVNEVTHFLRTARLIETKHGVCGSVPSYNENYLDAFIIKMFRNHIEIGFYPNQTTREEFLYWNNDETELLNTRFQLTNTQLPFIDTDKYGIDTVEANEYYVIYPNHISAYELSPQKELTETIMTKRMKIFSDKINSDENEVIFSFSKTTKEQLERHLAVINKC